MNRSTSLNNPAKYLRSTISLKLGEGDFTGAVRLASSRDSVAPVNDATFSALLTKHPLPHPASSMPPPPEAAEINVTPEMVANAFSIKFIWRT